MEAVDAYEKALEMAPDNMSKASIHKNMTIAYELLCKLGSLQSELHVYNFEQIIKHANKALQLGYNNCIKWVANLVERGAQWDQLLATILQDQTATVKSNYYERFCLKTSRENCDFLMRIQYRLCQSTFNESVQKSEIRDYKRANCLIIKSIQLFNQYNELYERY